MNQLLASKNRKKQSAFQKLWAQAERYKKKNARFRDKLEALVQRVQTTIRPAEYEAARADKTLLHKLLTLGQRKSLAQWQRSELDLWIHELLDEMQRYALVDPALQNDMARYDAFRMGITLEDDQIAPPVEQLMEIFKRQQAEYEAAAEARREARVAAKQAEQEEAKRRVEIMLNRRLGPEPAQPKSRPVDVEDLWQDELDLALEQQRVRYWEVRAKLQKELLDELLEEIDREYEFEAETLDVDEDELFDFDFGGDDEDSDPEPVLPNAPKITNQVFQRVFRSTAAKLHPDREPDPTLRKVKQGLMVDLLRARKKGDVITVLELYQAHVGTQDNFSKADEKQLLAALEHQINELQSEQEEIAEQSAVHQMVYERFYYSSKKKVDKAIAEHLARVAQDKIEIEQMVTEIRSLKTLKPWLEQRYDDRQMAPSFAEFIDMFEQKMRF